MMTHYLAKRRRERVLDFLARATLALACFLAVFVGTLPLASLLCYWAGRGDASEGIWWLFITCITLGQLP